MSEYILEVSHISKEFPGVKALTDVSLTLKAGETHSIVGENGAGKSTLMKIISGIYPLEIGTMKIQGQEVHLRSIRDAFDHGIALVHQELVNCQKISVAENLFMSKITRSKKKFINHRKLSKRTKEELDRFDCSIHPESLMQDLSVSEQQIVEIAKALSLQARVIIFDEPTASLTEKETQKLFAIIEQLKRDGVGILYISHRMEEICAISDRITVLRDGNYIGTFDASSMDTGSIVDKMIGRKLTDYYPPKSTGIGEILLEAKNYSHKGYYRNVSFYVRKGEIVGFSGLIGAGRSELFKGICALDKKDSGELVIRGKQIRAKTYENLVQEGVVYLTEDRKTEGLFLQMPIKKNISALELDNIKEGLFLSEEKENHQAEEYREKLRIKCASIDQMCVDLSGGNQQKVLIAKALTIHPQIIILDEPTKGIDVGAKSEIYNMLRELAESGIGVVIISSDLSEVIGLSDRVLIMHEGSLVGEASKEDINEQYILHRASGIEKDEK